MFKVGAGFNPAHIQRSNFVPIAIPPSVELIELGLSELSNPKTIETYSGKNFRFTLPLRLISCVVRGAYQARGKLKHVSQVEVASKWIVLLPLFSLGVYLGNPVLAWGAFLVDDLVATLVLCRPRVKSQLSI